MRVITHCPACQTQFFATEEQLNKHGGKVRCGQCMHVFDARSQLITVADQSENQTDNVSSHEQPSGIATDTIKDAPESGINSNPTVNQIDSTTVEIPIAPVQQQPSYLTDTGKKFKANTKSSINNTRRWLWGLASLLLLVALALQSIYFLRDEIAIYYPDSKPYLLQLCEKLSCSINLPQKIEFIVIDDSDMQEDADRTGLVRFSSTLINRGSHVVAYPNLELTLTDTDDAPVIRRVFKPDEYLPAGTNLAEGIVAGAETRINLAITTSDISVSGYRVFVTY